MHNLKDLIQKMDEIENKQVEYSVEDQLKQIYNECKDADDFVNKVNEGALDAVFGRMLGKSDPLGLKGWMQDKKNPGPPAVPKKVKAYQDKMDAMAQSNDEPLLPNRNNNSRVQQQRNAAQRAFDELDSFMQKENIDPNNEQLKEFWADLAIDGLKGLNRWVRGIGKGGDKEGQRKVSGFDMDDARKNPPRSNTNDRKVRYRGSDEYDHIINKYKTR